MKENRINQTLSAILKNITDNIDVNTIVGSSIKTEDGVATVVVDGENVLVDDSNIISLLETFK